MVNRVLHILAVVGMFAFSSCGSGDSSNSAEPTPTPGIDYSITAEKIRGNVQKYIGARVAFYCKIDNVIEGGVANATCGPRVALVGEPAQPRDIMNVTAMQKWTDELSTWTNSQSHVAFLVLVGNRAHCWMLENSFGSRVPSTQQMAPMAWGSSKPSQPWTLIPYSKRAVVSQGIA